MFPEPARRRSRYEAQDDPVVPPYPSRVDLHCHSDCSDGVMDPRGLVEAAAEAGVKILALSDHDTLEGVREVLRAAGARAGEGGGRAGLPLELLPSIEINSLARGIPDLWEGELHILGPGVDVEDEAFEATLQRQRGFRLERFHKTVDRLRELGMPIDALAQELLARHGAASGASLGRPLIGRCLVKAGFAESVDDSMKRLLGRGCPAYVQREGLGPKEAIQAIKAAGGLPVLAHFADAPRRRPLVAELMEWGLAGLEVHYRRFDAPTVAEMEALARELRLVPTGGSDFHGDGETDAQAHAELFVPEEDAVRVYGALGRAIPTAALGSMPA